MKINNHSQEYFAENPTVSFRLPKSTKERLQQIAAEEGKTPGQFVRDFLSGLVEKRETAEEAYWKGYNEAAKDFGIKFTCSKCGKPCYIKPETVKELLEEINLSNWAHSSCIDEEENE